MQNKYTQKSRFYVILFTIFLLTLFLYNQSGGMMAENIPATITIKRQSTPKKEMYGA